MRKLAALVSLCVFVSLATAQEGEDYFSVLDENPANGQTAEEEATGGDAESTTTADDDLVDVEPVAADALDGETNADLQATVTRLQTQIRQLEDRLSTLQRALDELRRESGMQGLLGRVASDDDLRREFSRAAQGKVHITNYRGVRTPIYINGTRWMALPEESHIFAPVGRVAFQASADAEPDVRDDWSYVNGELQLRYTIHAATGSADEGS